MNVCVIGVALILSLPSPSCSNSDDLLMGTLKVMERASCDDDDVVALSCPVATMISIQIAQYGKASSNTQICTEPVDVFETEDCLWPNILQYSLLQTVIEACQKKRDCKFSTKPKPGLEDPCPHTRKFVDVSYKCRPFEFRSRSCCQGETIKLSCNPHSRVAIFDAQYGRNSFEPTMCYPTGPHNETCMAPHTLDTVMQICHGKRRCEIDASYKLFGSPCQPTSRTYLKIAYACVPLGVLMERYESKLEDDERPNGRKYSATNITNFFTESEGAGKKWEEPSYIPVVTEQRTISPTLSKPVETTTQRSRKIPTGTESSQTQLKQKIFIYIGIGVILLIILVFILLVVRYYVVRKSLENSKNGDMFSTEPPNVFNDGVSDIDNDIDVCHISGTFYDPVHPDMILYRDTPGNKGTLRAMRPLSTIYPSGVSMYGNDCVLPPAREIKPMKDEERVTSPKSLGTYSNSQFYYG